eukprot:9467903-Pyramimonas_sp.AAC.1
MVAHARVGPVVGQGRFHVRTPPVDRHQVRRCRWHGAHVPPAGVLGRNGCVIAAFCQARRRCPAVERHARLWGRFPE